MAVQAPISNPFEANLRQQYAHIDVDQLKRAIQILPSNYDYEILKTVLKILKAKHDFIEKLDAGAPRPYSYKVSLQFPEGLLLHSTLIADILTQFCSEKSLENCVPVECLILGDVTYGACCIDDLASKRLACDFIVHYGHSCLVPIPDMTISNVLYVFVEIGIDIRHLLESVAFNFAATEKIYLLGIVQFNTTLVRLKHLLVTEKCFTDVTIPMERPRASGEVLGCTSPDISLPAEGSKGALGEPGAAGSVIFVGDGRFHIESCMIRNSHLRFFQYDPFKQQLTHEVYKTEQMRQIRQGQIEKAKDAELYGIILGTLGRQGNTSVLEQIQALFDRHNKKYFVMFLSEILPAKLARFPKVGAWVQIACPRLSIDWGHFYEKPLLSTFEAFAMLGEAQFPQSPAERYPMDFYSDQGGPWTNYWKRNQEKAAKKKARLVAKGKKKAAPSTQIAYEDQTQ